MQKSLILLPFIASLATAAGLPWTVGLSPGQLARLPVASGPWYNPEDWSFNLTVTTENTYKEFYRFPDENLRQPVNQDGDSNKFDVFCWQNGTDDVLVNVTFLRTTGNAYINEKWIVNGTNYVFEDLLPWCGPYRPYRGLGGNFHMINYQWPWVPCLDDAQNRSSTVRGVGPSTVDVYCWVVGANYTKTNIWWLNADFINEVGDEDKSCYVPDDFLERSGWNESLATSGPGGPCPV